MHVVILMSDTGGGHRSLSRAIAAGLGEGNGHATIFEPFATAASRLPGTIMRLYAPIIQRLPVLYGLAYDALDAPGRFARVGRVLGHSVVERIATLLLTERPDVVVCAHALTTTLALDAIDRAVGRGAPRSPLAAMVTELATVHWSWIDPRVDRYLAATDEVVRALSGHGIDVGRIRQTGLPVGRQFGAIDEPPADLRRRLRLSPDRTTALVLAGGEGSDRLAQLVPALALALPDLQVVVVCGRNESLRRRLDGYGLPPAVRIRGFVDNMAELMHAADFVLTKGGPQTIAETLAAGRPTVVTELLPGQERGNGAYVVRHGAGYLALTLPDVLAASRRLASDPVERARLAAAAREIGPRRAATKAAGELRALAARPAAV